MTTIKKDISRQIRRTRCHRGYRRDKKTQTCVKYDIFKTFKHVKDVNISPIGKTFTIESVGEDGAILKMYHEGDYHHQILVDKDKLHNIKHKTHSHFKHIFKTVRKINSEKISKDKKFQEFKRNLDKHTAEMVGGGINDTSNTNKTTIMVHDAIFDDVTTDSVSVLQANVNKLQAKLNRELKQETTEDHSNYWSVFFLVNFFQEVILNELVPTVQEYGTYWTGYRDAWSQQTGWYNTQNFSAMGTTLSIDLYGGLFMVVLNIITTFYPNGEMDEITRIAQYVYWSWLIVSAPWLIATVGWWGLTSIISPVLGFYASTQMTVPSPDSTTVSKSTMKIQNNLLVAKQKLAAAIERDANNHLP